MQAIIDGLALVLRDEALRWQRIAQYESFACQGKFGEPCGWEQRRAATSAWKAREYREAYQRVCNLDPEQVISTHLPLML